MIGRRALVGLSLLCALVFSAVAASSALAVEETTAYTCVKGGGAKDFTDAHCKTKGAGEFGHVEIPPNTATEIEGSNKELGASTTEELPGTLEVTSGGVPVQIICTKGTATGTLTNKIEGSERYVHGIKLVAKSSGCTVPKPADKTGTPLCAIKGGTMTGNNATATTLKQGDNVLFKPEVGETFTIIEFENHGTNKCPFGKVAISGSFKAQADGATLSTTHATMTAEKTLLFGKAPVGITGTATMLMKEVEGVKQNPISVTTT